MNFYPAKRLGSFFVLLAASFAHARAVQTLAPEISKSELSNLLDTVKAKNHYAYRNEHKELVQVKEFTFALEVEGKDLNAEYEKLVDALLAVGKIREANPDFHYSLNKALNGVARAKITIKVPAEDLVGFLSLQVDETVTSSFSTLSLSYPEFSKVENSSVGFAKELFAKKEIKDLVYSYFLFEHSGRANAPKPNEELTKKLHEVLDKIKAKKSLEYYFNDEQALTENQWNALVHVLSSGFVTYGTQWGASYPMKEKEAFSYFVVALRMIDSYVSTGFNFLIYPLENAFSCLHGEIPLKLVNQNLVRSNTDNFCAKQTTGKSRVFDGAYYDSSSFQYLQTLLIVSAFKTVDGKSISYERDPSSSIYSPVYILKIQ